MSFPLERCAAVLVVLLTVGSGAITLATHVPADGPGSPWAGPASAYPRPAGSGAVAPPATNPSDTVSLVSGQLYPGVLSNSQVTLPQGAAYDPANGEVYVTGGSTSNVEVVNASRYQPIVLSIPVGSDPGPIAYDPANGDVYVVNSHSSNLTVISTATNRVVAPNVGVGGTDPSGIALDPLNGYLYVVNTASNNVSVINGATNSLIGPGIRVGTDPSAIAFDATNDELYVANGFSKNVTVISGSTDRVVVPSLGVGSSPEAVAVDPVANYVVVANHGSDNLTVINAATNTVAMANVPVGVQPAAIAYSGASSDLYIANSGSGNLTILRGSNIAVTLPSLGVGPSTLALLNASGGSVWAISSTSDNVSVVSARTNSVVVSSFALGSAPEGLAFDNENGELFVSQYSDERVAALNATSYAVLTTNIVVGVEPLGLAFDPDNGYVYVTNFGSNNVTAINASTGRVAVPSIAVGSGPWGIAFDPENGYLYVANSQSANLTVINATSNVGIATIATGVYPQPVVYDPVNEEICIGLSTGNEVVVVNATSNSLTFKLPGVIDPVGLAYDASTATLYTANAGSTPTVTPVNVVRGAVGNSFNIAGTPQGMTLDPWNGYLYVAMTPSSGGEVGVYSTSGVLQATSPTGPSPYAVLIDPLTTAALTANMAGGSISVWPTIAGAGKYPVTFTENGLPSGTEWGVNISTQAPLLSSLSTIQLSLANGSYAYSVYSSDPSYVASLSSSTIHVNGAVVATSVSFSFVTFAVPFLESGLPSGTEWWVNLTTGFSANSTRAQLTINLTYGPYSALVASANPVWGPRPARYNFTVSSSTSPVEIAFQLEVYVASFVESGLPGGTTWSLSVGAETNASVAPSPINVTLTNGTYPYLLAAVPGFSPSSYAGQFTIAGRSRSVPIAWTPFVYAVTFTETGLPTGTAWSVTLAGTPKTTTTGEVAFAIGNGSYAWAVPPITGYLATPSRGDLAIDGGPASVALQFQPIYTLTFEESGLPAGTLWSVRLNSTSSSEVNRSTGASLSFSLNATGPYSYLYGSVAGFTVPSFGGTLIVSGSNTISTTFSVGYEVAFQPSGGSALLERAPIADLDWSVSISGGSFSSPLGDPIDVWLANGSYPFAVVPPAGYGAISPSGTVLVDGRASAVTVPIAPSASLYDVTFSESGLPTGARWNVTVSGFTVTVLTDRLVETLPNGSFAFAVVAPHGYQADPSSGSDEVEGGPLAIAILFGPPSPPRYEVEFVESGLPLGTSWSVALNGTTNRSTSGSISFTVANGTWDYRVGALPGYGLPRYAGSVVVAGASPSPVDLAWTLVTYTVTFEESGLPAGTPWTVVLGGTSQSTNRTELAFLEPNGSYVFTLRATGFGATPSEGSLSVAGAPTTLTVAFAASAGATSGSSALAWVAVGGGGAAAAAVIVLVALRRKGRGSAAPAAAESDAEELSSA